MTTMPFAERELQKLERFHPLVLFTEMILVKLLAVVAVHISLLPAVGHHKSIPSIDAGTGPTHVRGRAHQAGK